MTRLTHSGTLTVAGNTSGNATTATVNGSSATLYGDGSFAKAGFSVTNGINSFTAVATDALGRSDSHTVTVNLPSTLTYAYDSNGNLRSDGRRFFDYDDDIGNRTSAGTGGDENGLNLRSATYTSNSLNEYTQQTVPGGVDILGLANPAALVTVSGQTVYRKGEYFREEISLNNASAAVYSQIDTVATFGTTSTTNSGFAFRAQTPESLTYDLDGNLTQDGRWTYTWDAENRLTKLESLSSAPTTSKRKVEMEYDFQSRRIKKLSYTHNGSAWVLHSTTKFLYDGWNVICELDSANTLTRSYLWGLDLSGGLQGAGGVGGLVSSKPSGGSAHFAAYDGNGNVMGLVDGATGTLSAQYEYGPFGETLRATGSQAEANPIRFSSKREDPESGFLYYGYRFYNPAQGRWINRDPIEEGDGPHLSGFLANDGCNKADAFGLKWIVNRSKRARAEAWVTGTDDTFDGLGQEIGLDTKDYKKWAQTSDTEPGLCTMYTVPNTIYIDVGVLTTKELMPTSVFSMWLSLARTDKASWERHGFLVRWDEGVLDSDILEHLQSDNIHGYLFIGHGAPEATIHAVPNDPNGGLIPDRYTKYGISFMYLNACFTAQRRSIAGRAYTYNARESNVATRGWFKGFTGDVCLLNEIVHWAVARGKNDNPYVR